jgi:hypothetical protein
MVAFHPDDFNFMPGIGELADIAEKFPVLFGQAAEVQVGKDIAQQDKPLETERLQKRQRVGCPAYIRTQVQVRNNDCIEAVFHHALYL